MSEIQVRAELVWVDEHGEQVGAKLSFGEQHVRAVDITIKEILHNYKDKLSNAIVTDKGIFGKDGIALPEQRLVRKTGKSVATYTLMHADTAVCRVYPLEDKIEVAAGEYLPFALTGGYVRLMDSEGNYLLDADGFRRYEYVLRVDTRKAARIHPQSYGGQKSFAKLGVSEHT